MNAQENFEAVQNQGDDLITNDVSTKLLSSIEQFKNPGPQGAVGNDIPAAFRSNDDCEIVDSGRSLTRSPVDEVVSSGRPAGATAERQMTSRRSDSATPENNGRATADVFKEMTSHGKPALASSESERGSSPLKDNAQTSRKLDNAFNSGLYSDSVPGETHMPAMRRSPEALGERHEKGSTPATQEELAQALKKLAGTGEAKSTRAPEGATAEARLKGQDHRSSAADPATQNRGLESINRNPNAGASKEQRKIDRSHVPYM